MVGKYFIKKLENQGEDGKRQLSVGIPKDIQESFDLQENDYVFVEKRKDGIYFRKLDKNTDTVIGHKLEDWEIEYHQDFPVAGINRNKPKAK